MKRENKSGDNPPNPSKCSTVSMGRAKSVHTSEIYHSTDIQPHNNEKLNVSQSQQFEVTKN